MSQLAATRRQKETNGVESEKRITQHTEALWTGNVRDLLSSSSGIFPQSSPSSAFIGIPISRQYVPEGGEEESFPELETRKET